MRQCGSLDYTRTTLKALKEDLSKEIASLGGHEKLVSLIEHLDNQIDEMIIADSSTV